MTGIDIVEIDRIREKAEKETFLTSVFTKGELEYYCLHGKRAETLAGMFCAKEAAAKALGTGFAGFRPVDIEVVHDDLGAPKIRLNDKIVSLLKGRRIEISISHCKEYATAVCVIYDGAAEI